MGYNLFSSVSLGAWEKAIVWNTLSPRAGLAVDLFGHGRTVLKGTWARLPEYLGLGYSQDLAPIDPLASHDFLWYDEDGDGLVDTSDTYSLVSYDYRVYKSEFFRQAVDPDLTAPVITEWTAGLEQQVGRDFTLSARYIERRHANNIGHVVYDPSTGARWWQLDDSPDGWWVPFDTVVPGTDGYADVPVTVYLRSSTAPDFFERIENVPELTAKYRSVEFTFRKKMSHNWQLYGTLAWNRATGTTTMASRWSAGNSPVLLTPNAFTNISADDVLLQDRPLVARLAGTVHFGGGFFASVLFKAQSGTPWARTVTIIPPAGVGRGQRRPDGARHRLPGEPRLAPPRRVEEPGPAVGEGVRQGRPGPRRALGRRLQPARRQVPDARPQRRRDLGPRRGGRQHGHARPQRPLQHLPAAVGDAGRPPQPEPKILAGTRRTSSAPRPRPRS